MAKKKRATFTLGQLLAMELDGRVLKSAKIRAAVNSDHARAARDFLERRGLNPQARNLFTVATSLAAELAAELGLPTQQLGPYHDPKAPT